MELQILTGTASPEGAVGRRGFRPPNFPHVKFPEPSEKQSYLKSLLQL